VLLRRVIGDALRARRQGQQRTLREISSAANVSLGYLSEIERGQKEASSELLASICQALGSQLSEVLRDASDSLARAERTDQLVAEPLLAEVAAPVPDGEVPAARPASEAPVAAGAESPRATLAEGEVLVAIRHDGPLRTTLHAVRARRRGQVARAN
jgi:transcriptional regulator with XRE-family HTH domain